MGWQARLQLTYRRADDRSVVHDRHDGPLRVLRSLYPEGPGICHSVLVHPPGGIVGGDTLAVDVRVGQAAHALVTTAGATRFYRSTGADAAQVVDVHLDEGARLEWLPLETLAFSGCLAESRLSFTLAPGAESIGWDMVALGLPASNQPFEKGRYTQAIEVPGRWLERGRIDAGDRRLLDSPLGLAGHRVMGTLWFIGDAAMADARRDLLLESARAVAMPHPLAATTGVTAPQPGIVVLRVLAGSVEPAMALLTQTWIAWRAAAWGLVGTPPRVWRT
ncbi:MAG: urease accessory protein UreD [Caldimonas sp.]